MKMEVSFSDVYISYLYLGLNMIIYWDTDFRSYCSALNVSIESQPN